MSLISLDETTLQSAEYPVLDKLASKICGVPQHVAIAMDGNRRWATKRFMPAMFGHWKGAEVITKVVRAAASMGIKVLTLYAFSTENWNRSKNEVDELMKVFSHYLKKNLDFMLKEGVRLNCIGDLTKLPPGLQELFAKTMEATKYCESIDLVLAINYGGRDEICRAFRSIAQDLQKGLLKKEDISEDLISSYLDTAKWKDPDLFIRTSGEQRLSNFLLWQFSYTEVYITKTLWPDFDESNLLQAVLEYQKRQRRLGGA
ncbi:MAG: isoprenyl transferase [Chlamydiae bacterium]|nr:isoprenyl transferase [Chlamydiota bacterium]